ncbi:gp53-like domain-containing protein [Enterobacter roggenkampii]|uniref:gp53-like domain-containing protein n=3 Tax=Enterobacter roggenkampii TaxID=1812935 RepID=UPI000E1DAF9F|nr:hypothetical protein [Enterobacter roggenkampii]RDT11545.1 hypothetical protein DXF88_24015 [Enterobacter roggenkampii]
MHRIDTPTAQVDKFGSGKNGFTRGNPQTGTPATDLDDDYFDMLQEELVGIVEAAGLSLDKTKHNQLRTALPLFLGLGTASKKNIGTGAGQIPDMSFFTLGLSGAFRLPTGHIIQTGSGTANGGFTQAYPYPFPGACLALIGTVYGTLGQRAFVTTNSSDRTAANLNVVDINGNGLNASVGYIAIGY